MGRRNQRRSRKPGPPYHRWSETPRVPRQLDYVDATVSWAPAGSDKPKEEARQTTSRPPCSLSTAQTLRIREGLAWKQLASRRGPGHSTFGLSTRGQQALLPTTAYHATPPATSICALGTAHAAPAGQSDVFSCCRAVHPIPRSRQLPARADGPAGALYSRRSGHTVQASVRTAAGS